MENLPFVAIVPDTAKLVRLVALHGEKDNLRMFAVTPCRNTLLSRKQSDKDWLVTTRRFDQYALIIS